MIEVGLSSFSKGVLDAESRVPFDQKHRVRAKSTAGAPKYNNFDQNVSKTQKWTITDSNWLFRCFADVFGQKCDI